MKKAMVRARLLSNLSFTTSERLMLSRYLAQISSHQFQYIFSLLHTLISSSILLLASMASTLRFWWLPTVKAAKKCCTMSTAAQPRSILLAPSINEGKQTCASQVERKRDWRILCKDDSSAFELQQPSDLCAPMKLVAEFYRLINDKDKTGVLELISDDCCYEDLVFYLPFQGKEQIRGFLHELMDSMGPHVKFVVENVTNGRKNSAGVKWHLEWREKRIPFATGYNYFEFHEVGGKLRIGKIRGLEELPVKPGDLILKLLKTVATLFDRYPVAADGLLSTPQDMHDGISVILHIFGERRDHSDPSKKN